MFLGWYTVPAFEKGMTRLQALWRGHNQRLLFQEMGLSLPFSFLFTFFSIDCVCVVGFSERPGVQRKGGHGDHAD